MRSLFRLNSKVSLFLLMLAAALTLHPAGAAILCTDLPPSTLEVDGVKTSKVEEMMVPSEALDRIGQAVELASRHTLMLTVIDLAVWFNIAHRVVPRADGLVCDAPSLVRMGFGSSRRRAFLAHPAAMDACVRQQMLDHEAAHNRAFDEVVRRFIAQHRSDFQRGMVALKQAPAPTPEAAKAQWETGLKVLLTEARQQLLTDIRSANAHVDDPSALAALENACGGKIRQLEQTQPLIP
jgi:hypothetical protein